MIKASIIQDDIESKALMASKDLVADVEQYTKHEIDQERRKEVQERVRKALLARLRRIINKMGEERKRPRSPSPIRRGPLFNFRKR